jgi:hypothetical protein
MNNNDWKLVYDGALNVDTMVQWAQKPWYNAADLDGIPITDPVVVADGDVIRYSMGDAVFTPLTRGATGARGATGVTGTAGVTGLGLGATGANPLYNDIYVLTDTKPTGTSAGTMTTGNWFPRVLNTLTSFGGTRVTLSANQFTLQPGTWYIYASGAFAVTVSCAIRLFNVSTSTVTAGGTSSSSSQTLNPLTTAYSVIQTVVTIATPQVYRIEYRALVAFFLGVPTNFPGVPEVYLQVTCMYIRA